MLTFARSVLFTRPIVARPPAVATFSGWALPSPYYGIVVNLNQSLPMVAPGRCNLFRGLDNPGVIKAKEKGSHWTTADDVNRSYPVSKK
jgi:hypothetical protein